MMGPVYLLGILMDAGASSYSLGWWLATCWWSCTARVVPFITLNFCCISMEWLSGWSGGKVDLQESSASQTNTMVWSKLWAQEALEAWAWRVLCTGCWSLEPALCGSGPDTSVVLAVCPMNQKEVGTDCWRKMHCFRTRDMYCLWGNKCSVNKSHIPGPLVPLRQCAWVSL